MVSQAVVASRNTAASFLNTFHLMKTRNAHQVSALALAILQEKLFYKQAIHSSIQDWKENMKKTCLMFLYWDTAFTQLGTI